MNDKFVLNIGVTGGLVMPSGIVDDDLHQYKYWQHQSILPEPMLTFIYNV